VGSRRRHLLSIGIPRDFPAVTLSAIIEAVLTLWAINQSRAERAASA
jgi:hypothetical protein